MNLLDRGGNGEERRKRSLRFGQFANLAVSVQQNGAFPRRARSVSVDRIAASG